MKRMYLITVLILLFFSIKTFGQPIHQDSCKVIKIEVYKYEYLITAVNLSINDTILIVSEKHKIKEKENLISVDSTYLFCLMPLIDLAKVSAMPPNSFRLRTKDKRILWTSGQDIKLIPFKASNLKGLILLSASSECLYPQNRRSVL